MPTIVHVPNVFDPDAREFHDVPAGTNLRDYLVESGLYARARRYPTIVALNAEELTEDQYDRELQRLDLVVVTTLAEDPATVVFGLALSTWAVIATVTVLALSIYMMTQEPDIPETADQKEGSPTYSISARGNKARLGSPKPVVYGEFRTYPDLAAHPFSEFENGEDEVLYQLFEVTQGQADIPAAQMRFEDTNLSNFGDYEVEVIPPGQKSTIYPSAVNLSSEVANIEINDAVVGPYAACAPAQKITRIAFDIVAPAGLYNQDREDGSLRNYTVKFRLEARAIDDNGVATGSWVTLGNESLSGNNRDAIRRTFTYPVAADRYEVRATRLTAKNDSQYISDMIQWSQLKGFLEDDTGITTTTRVAIKIRASEQIGNRALSKFNSVVKRKIQTWDPLLGWQVESLNANPVWVVCDILRANYGGDRADAYIDLAGMHSLAAQLDSEGVEFNGVFDTKGTVWDAITRVAQVARCVPVDRAGVIHLVRDSYSTMPAAMFTHRNIVKDSFTIDHIGVLEETSDSVNIEYFDKAEDYRPATVLCALPGSSAQTPRNVRYFGVTDRDQAFKLGMYLTAQNQYRRQKIRFDTGVEGYIPMYGDVVAVSHYMLGQEGADQVSGEIKAFDGVDLITLTEGISHLTNPYVIIRSLDGTPSSPLRVTAVADKQARILDAFSAGDLVFDSGYERPHFMCGEGSDYHALVKINKISPQSDNRIRIEGFVDNPLVYTAADGLQVPPIDVLPETSDIYPVVTNLQAQLLGTVDSPEVILSWEGKNSDHYQVEFSDDGGNEWLPLLPRPKEPRYNHFPEPGTLQYRVAGVNLFRSAWVSVVVDTTDVQFSPPPAITNLALAESFTGATLKLQWDSDTHDHRIVFSVSSVEKYADTFGGTTYELPAAVAQAHAMGRSFDVEVFAIAPNGKLATTSPLLSVSNPAPAALNNLTVEQVLGGGLAAFDWPADLDLAGISVWASTTTGFAPSSGNLVVSQTKNPVVDIALEDGTWYVVVAAVDVWGDTALNYSGEFTVEGGGALNITETDIQDDSISTPKLKANAVTASKIFVSTLSAIAANLGTITAGLLKTVSGTGKRVEIEGGSTLPFWIGNGSKSESNGVAYYKEADNSFTQRDPTTGFYVKTTPGGANPWVASSSDGSNFLRAKSDGTLEARGLTILDDTGAVLLASGTGLDWSDVSGIGRPEDNATVGADSTNLQTGTGVNQIYNSDFSNDMAGWLIWDQSGGDPDFSHGFDWVADWTLVSDSARTAYIRQSGDADSFVYDFQTGKAVISCSEGDRLEGFCYTGAHRCNVSVIIAWYDADGIYLSANTLQTNASEKAGGKYLADYKKTGGFAVAPASTASAKLLIRKQSTNSGQADSYAFFTMAYIGYATAAQAELSPWSDGAPKGAFATLNQITGSNISTYIANAAINNAQMGNASVNTLQLAGQAVTIPTSSYESAQYNLDATARNIRTVSYTSSGSPVVITATALFEIISGNFDWIRIRILRGTYPIFDTGNIAGITDWWAFQIRDVPAAGPVTYNLEVRCDQNNVLRVFNRSITALEVKR